MYLTFNRDGKTASIELSEDETHKLKVMLYERKETRRNWLRRVLEPHFAVDFAHALESKLVRRGHENVTGCGAAPGGHDK